VAKVRKIIGIFNRLTTFYIKFAILPIIIHSTSTKTGDANAEKLSEGWHTDAATAFCGSSERKTKSSDCFYGLADRLSDRDGKEKTQSVRLFARLSVYLQQTNSQI